MIITRTPLRVSFLGGGTDTPAWYERHGVGEVLNAAIGLYVTVVVARHYDPKRYRLAYRLVQTTDDVEHIEHDLLRWALKRSGEVNGGVEMHTIADIPGEGSGLGSSASLLVGAIKALAEWRGIHLGWNELADRASAIEIRDLVNGAGKQDHYIAAFGGVRRMVFRPREPSVLCQQLFIEPGILQKWSRWMPLFPTGWTRLAGPTMLKTRSRIQEGLADRALQDTLSAMTVMERALADGDMEEVGKLLNWAWDLKKQAAPHVSVSDLETQYRQAIDAGALGGKLCGAGGGGYWLFVVPPIRQEDVARALYHSPIRVAYGVGGSSTIFAEDEAWNGRS